MGKLKDVALGVSARLIGRRNIFRLGRMLYAYGRWEPPNSIDRNGERTLVENSLRNVSRPIVFDVGANVGEWSSSVLEVNSNAKIYAFEPSPQSRERLRALPIEVVPCAVADFIGEAPFTLSGATNGTNSLVPLLGGQKIEVKVTTISRFASQQGIDHIDLLKIDVEGYDLAVLRGAESLFKSGAIAVAQFEYNGLWIHTRTFLKDVFDFAAAISYRLGKVVPPGVLLYPHWHYELDRYFESNYVLVREDMLPHVSLIPATFDHFNTYGP